jgi:hypothetical protein
MKANARPEIPTLMLIIIGSILASSPSPCFCLTFSDMNMSLRSTIHRYESPFFTSSDGNQRTPSALIILNTPIINLSQDRDGSNEGNDDVALSGVLGVLWKASSYRVCADGGANRLYDATVAIMNRKEEEGVVGVNDAVSNINCNPDFLPDLITGDLDSLRSDVRMYYESKGVPVIRVQDQDYHDLDVSMHMLMIDFLSQLIVV